jgi:hypothetical protein
MSKYMHDSIRRRVEERRTQASAVRIERIAKDVESGERHLSLMSSHVTSELKRRMIEMDADTNVATATAHSSDALREFGGLRTREQLESHLVERLSLDVFTPSTTFDLTVQSGTRFLGPPYDQDWSEGNGMGAFARFDGRALTITKDNGFSAAGIGFFLSTTETVLAAITPQGTCDWSWAAFGDLPSARSRGGMGLTIYTDGQQQPTHSHQPVLWSVSGVTAFTGDKGSGRIADAASPAFGLGTVRLAPALLQMVRGSTYLVWVWSWQIARETGDPFIAFSSFDMPLVTIHAGPPVIIH